MTDLQVAAVLCGKTQFSLNDVHAVCAGWPREDWADADGWPGLHAVATFSSPDIALAKQAIFQTLQ